MGFRVETTDDPRVALDAAGDHLRSDPVGHNLLLSILHARLDRPVPGRYWWSLGGDGSVAGFALNTPPTFSAALSPCTGGALEALVAAMARDVPGLPGANGEAATSAAFAGQWAELLSVPVRPVEGQRLYRLGRLAPAPTPPGSL